MGGGELLICTMLLLFGVWEAFTKSCRPYGPYSYSRFSTGTSLQWRLMRGNIIGKS